MTEIEYVKYLNGRNGLLTSIFDKLQMKYGDEQQKYVIDKFMNSISYLQILEKF